MLSKLAEDQGELERQKAGLMVARENLLKARGELEEAPSPELEVEEVDTPKWTRAPGGLAQKAAKMAAATKAQAEKEGRKPLARLRCKVCSTVIPIYTGERPLEIICPNCGKEGILK
jgi:hypothetical protein